MSSKSLNYAEKSFPNGATSEREAAYINGEIENENQLLVNQLGGNTREIKQFSGQDTIFNANDTSAMAHQVDSDAQIDAKYDSKVTESPYYNKESSLISYGGGKRKSKKLRKSLKHKNKKSKKLRKSLKHKKQRKTKNK